MIRTLRLKTSRQLVLITWLLTSSPCLSANSQFDAGVSSFNKKDYKAALVHFDKVLVATPNDCNTIYYKAVSLNHLGMNDQAQILYATLIRNFSGTEAARQAEIGLASLNPRYLRQLKPQPAQTEPPAKTAQPHASSGETEESVQTANDDLALLPKRSKIYFEKEGKNLGIDASINGRPIKMLFDSGAENVALGKNHLALLGIRPPETAPIGKAYGVGEGGAQQIWAMRVTLKVGDIERKNFPITIQEDMPTKPLLGQTFFKDFLYEVDNGARTITFVKKDADVANADKDPNAIPFKREGNEIIVQVEVNGRPIPMYLDTGAEQIYFTPEQARAAGLEIPEDAAAGISEGIAGKTAVKSFVVPRMKCGPIIKTDVTVTVAESPPESDSTDSGSTKTKKIGLHHPLLGQEFFGDFRLTVDNQANVIRMRR